MKKKLLLGISCAVCSVIPVTADVVQISKSISPSCHYFVTIQTNEAEDPALQIRSSNGHAIIQSFDWEQFSSHVGPDSVKILWKADSEAFTATTMMNRGFSGSVCFAFVGKQWIQVDIPQFRPPLDSKYQWKTRGKGAYAAQAWRNQNMLRMISDEDYYAFDPTGNAHLAPPYSVYLHFNSTASGASFKIAKYIPEKIESGF